MTFALAGVEEPSGWPLRRVVRFAPGEADGWAWPRHRIPEEHVFVPRGAGEGEGWLLGPFLDLERRASGLAVFEAQHLADGPALGRHPPLPPAPRPARHIRAGVKAAFRTGRRSRGPRLRSARRGLVRQGNRGAVGRGVVWLGPAWRVPARHGKAWNIGPRRFNGTASIVGPLVSLPLAIACDSRQIPSMTAAFDTITAVRRLEDAGLSREAAEAITAGDLEASGAGRDALATKADLQAGLAELEARMTWRIIGIVIAANALLLAAFKLIP